jgi:hypothetical protein
MAEALKRCAGCGKTIEPGTKFTRITNCYYSKNQSISEKSEWGVMHTSPCYNTSMDCPEAFREELKRIAMEKL